MATFMLPPNTHTVMSFKLNRTKIVQMHVDAAQAVRAYIVDAEGLARFRAEGVIDYLGGSGRVAYQDFIEELPPGQYYVLVVNDSKVPIPVNCDVRFSNPPKAKK